ncbi:FbpB family small basic protein [Salimicrobium flavidum]|uniref:Fur-regulated basic protein B n=1 Tax=Salimicrobium flavidum TaxID=570947 RepID=A0A1N7IMC1_9BACI|nr:FbpB family small basic protein [Salimicrobium flavidum]SIS38238.1 Fur-regulated basic protein B [Salimicrobium flavidum]
MRPQRVSFQDLVRQNREQLWSDEKQIEKIEKQIDEKHMKIVNPKD